MQKPQGCMIFENPFKVDKLIKSKIIVSAGQYHCLGNFFQLVMFLSSNRGVTM